MRRAPDRAIVLREARGGVATFLTMAYILFANPAILSAAGIPPDAAVAATAAAAGLCSILMGLGANFPLALAPGMGLNAVVALQVAPAAGSWQAAMGLVVLDGLVVLLLVVLGLREAVMHAIPPDLRRAIGAGIGIFIAFIGAVNARLVVVPEGTLAGLARDPGSVLPPVAPGTLREPETALAVVGLIIIGAALARGIRGALVLGIVFTSAIGLGLGLTALPEAWLSLPNFETVGQADIAGALRLSLVPLLLSLVMGEEGEVLVVGEELERGCVPADERELDEEPESAREGDRGAEPPIGDRVEGGCVLGAPRLESRRPERAAAIEKDERADREEDHRHDDETPAAERSRRGDATEQDRAERDREDDRDRTPAHFSVATLRQQAPLRGALTRLDGRGILPAVLSRIHERPAVRVESAARLAANREAPGMPTPRRSFLAALFFSVAAIAPAAAGPADPCALCAGSATIACPTCAGKKVFTGDCWLCEGKGKRACPFCGGAIEDMEWKGITPGKGLLPCPNPTCAKGVVTWETFGQTDKCRNCSGRGAIDCSFCLKTDFPCVPCGGKKKLQSACFDCRSTGAIPCPLCATKPDTAACALCAGAAGPDCPKCAATGRMTATCFACRGTDRAPCIECLGTGRQPCDECGGTGTMRIKLVNRSTGSEGKGGKESHAPCKGKGTVDCPDCQDRKAPCWVARKKENGHENGKYRIECEHCYGKGKIECGGCSRGSQRGLEIAASVLRRAGRHAEAVALLREAVKRAERWYASKKSRDDSAEEIEKRTLERETTLQRILGEIRRLDELASGGGGDGGGGG